MPETIIGEDNIHVDEEGITIKFQPDRVGRLSESGKNMVVVSTGGFIQIGEYKVSINVIKRRK